MKYSEWEAAQTFSPVSPEASAAEAAWNAAIAEARRLVRAAASAESSARGLAVLLDTELDFLDTGSGTTY